MGMPKAGKSTQLELVETVLKHEKKAVMRNVYEGARICPLDKKDRFQYNAWSFHNTINRIMESKTGCSDYLLIDRGVYDHVAFTHALYQCGQITNEQFEAQANYFQQFGFLEDAVLVFMVSPKESIERENKHHKFQGRVMNKEFLSALYIAYQEIIPTIQQEHYLIDGSKSLDGNGKEILDFVIEEHKNGSERI